MRALISILFLYLCLVGLVAQELVLDEQVEIQWMANAMQFDDLANRDVEIPQFQSAVFGDRYFGLPIWTKTKRLPSSGKLQVQITQAKYESITACNEDFAQLSDELLVESGILQSKGRYRAFVRFVPIVKRADCRYSKLISFRLQIRFEAEQNGISFRTSPFKTESVLQSGSWYKIATTEHDVYTITPDFINSMGISAQSIDPHRFAIFGNGGGTVPEPNSAERIDDLEQIPLAFYGDSDSQFEQGEYFLFFAQSPDDYLFDSLTQSFDVNKNPYSFDNFYFINTDTPDAMRIEPYDAPTQIDGQTDRYYDIQRYERELYNILDWRGSSLGSGKKWFGDIFASSTTKDFSSEFDLDGYVPQTTLKWSAQAAVVSFSGLSRFRVTVGDESRTKNFSTVPVNTAVNVEILKHAVFTGSFPINSSNISEVTVEFMPSTVESTGWLDYIQIEGYKALALSSGQASLLCRNPGAVGGIEYELKTTGPNTEIWELSDPKLPKRVSTRTSEDAIIFNIQRNGLTEFIAINPDRVSRTPRFVGVVANQNLHAINQADMLVVFHRDFEGVAKEFSLYRSAQSGMNVLAVNVEAIYNEFGGGSPDPTAIRDFCRMLYNRDRSFGHLLLIGDASFDMRHVRDDLKDQNFVTTYQTTHSYNPIKAYGSDDYFALLDENEGNATLSGALDIAVGRWPIQKEQDGFFILDKIKKYESGDLFFGDWKQRISLIADDEDGALHANQSETLAERLKDAYPNFEFSKIYLDAHVEQSNAGGDRYPTVNKMIDDNYARGQFVVNFIGHGGPRGWAQERILTIPQLLQWEQKNGYPILVTATCSFASFDDPHFTSAGELSLLKGGGGVVAILSTVRIVFASRNFQLITELFKEFFEKKSDGSLMTIGEVTRLAKNNLSMGSSTTNARKFGVFGDPSMRIMLPQYEVITSHINDQSTDQMSKTDTLSALSTIRLRGYIAHRGDIQTDFNGELDIKVFDKPVMRKTLGQKSTVIEYETQNSLIHRGKASVVDGRFSYEFVVPKNINYQFGAGKILYYAQSEQIDAAGHLDSIIVGGTSPNGIEDDQAPEVQLYLEDSSFRSGDEVPPNPTMIAELSDDFGINISGTSIGHDITAVLDLDERNTIILNDFFEATLDKPNEGRVVYQFQNLEEGLHSLTVTAWDIANNKGEASIEFLVVKKDRFDITKLFNYPNPFIDQTAFEFMHNLPTSALDIQIDIYTLSGQKIKTIKQAVTGNGNLVRGITWDGLDDAGTIIPRGIYLYKLKAISHNIGTNKTFSAQSKFERLLILK